MFASPTFPELRDRHAAWLTRQGWPTAPRPGPLLATLCHAVPAASVDQLWPAAIVGTFMVVLDDLFDDQVWPPERLRTYTDDLEKAILHPSPAAEPDPLARTIREARTALVRYPLFAILEPDWTAGLAAQVRATLFEYELQSRAVSGIGLERYLAEATASIGTTILETTLWTTLGGDEVREWLPQLRPVRDLMARVVRLANDLSATNRGHPDKPVGALAVLAAELGDGEPRAAAPDLEEKARGLLVADLQATWDRGAALAADIGASGHAAVDVVLRLTRLSCGFYLPDVDLGPTFSDEGVIPHD